MLRAKRQVFDPPYDLFTRSSLTVFGREGRNKTLFQRMIFPSSIPARCSATERSNGQSYNRYLYMSSDESEGTSIRDGEHEIGEGCRCRSSTNDPCVKSARSEGMFLCTDAFDSTKIPTRTPSLRTYMKIPADITAQRGPHIVSLGHCASPTNNVSSLRFV